MVEQDKRSTDHLDGFAVALRFFVKTSQIMPY